jgi:hypothetical protein
MSAGPRCLSPGTGDKQARLAVFAADNTGPAGGLWRGGSGRDQPVHPGYSQDCISPLDRGISWMTDGRGQRLCYRLSNRRGERSDRPCVLEPGRSAPRRLARRPVPAPAHHRSAGVIRRCALPPFPACQRPARGRRVTSARRARVGSIGYADSGPAARGAGNGRLRERRTAAEEPQHSRESRGRWPRRLLLRHLDAGCVGCQRVPRCMARERSAERAERQGGVDRARLRGMLGVDGHVERA